MERVGIIGFGRFGRALGTLLEEAGCAYRALDPAVSIPAEAQTPGLEDLASTCRFITLAVPIPALAHTLGSLHPFLGPQHVVFDVASVKVGPCRLLDESLGDAVPFAGTHPLFGPVSLAQAERPLRAVLCPSPRHPAAAQAVGELFLRLGLQVLEQSPEEHDRVMAQTHALTYFLAKGLLAVGCGEDLPFAPPSFHTIARTLDSVRGDAGHLFAAIQNENPFASGARGGLLQALGSIHRDLEEAQKVGCPPQEEALAIPDLGQRSSELQEARLVIDELDRTLLSLLARRMEVARKAGRVKARLGSPVQDPAREASLLDQRRAWAAEAGLAPETALAVFQVILRASRQIQGG